MQIRISTRHGNLSDETQSRITAKLEKMSRIFDRLTGIEATIDLEHRDEPTVDVRVSAEHKHDFVASHTGELLSSIDHVIHKLEQQLRKYKQKIQDHHRGTATKQAETSSESESAES